jgi:hypothetical protein
VDAEIVILLPGHMLARDGLTEIPEPELRIIFC